MIKTMRIGIFHDGISIPPKEGISVHAYELARTLSRQPGVEVILINADRSRAGINQLAEEPFDTLLLPPDEYYDQSTITEIIKEHNLDIVQNYNNYYIVSVLGPVAKRCMIPLIAEHHDLESELTFLRSSKKDGQFHQATQEVAIAYSSRSRFMSSHDFSGIQKSLPSDLTKKTFLMPVAFAPSTQTATHIERHARTAIFVGNMSYEPNRLAALDIINQIAPTLSDIEFVIVGRGSEHLPIPYEQTNIKLLGEVNDLQAVLSTASVGLAPLSMGSGLKIKLITYLEAGLPVIGSSIAMHGFPASEALLTANSPSEYGENIQALLASNEKWDHASRAARNLFSEYFDITKTIPRLMTLYQESVDNYRTPNIKDELTGPDMSHFPWHSELANSTYDTVRIPQYIQGKRQ